MQIFIPLKLPADKVHGGTPWRALIRLLYRHKSSLLQTIVSRQTDLTMEPAVLTVGKINGGVRENIIPESVELGGTIGHLTTAMQQDITCG